MKGIDVAYYCGKADWKKVKAAGVDFVMIKATQGHTLGSSGLYLFTDSQFTANVNGCLQYDIPFGMYHYLTATTTSEAKEEAAYFLKRISEYKDKIKLWVSVDVEDVSPAKYCGKLSKEALTAVVRTFMACIREAGYIPMLYTNPNYLKYKYIAHAFDQEDIWLAHYGVSKPYQCPNLKIWQYGYMSVDGIGSEVDGNTGYFTLPLKEDTLVEEEVPVVPEVTLPPEPSVPEVVLPPEFNLPPAEVEVKLPPIVPGEVCSVDTNQPPKLKFKPPFFVPKGKKMNGHETK